MDGGEPRIRAKAAGGPDARWSDGPARERGGDRRQWQWQQAGEAPRQYERQGGSAAEATE
eukprot:2116327-Alexandrium_andersonii.AAC.1